MPVIKIDYDKSKVKETVVQKIAVELQKTAAEASKLPLARVSVFARANQLTVNAAPIEIYVQVGSTSIPGGDTKKYLGLMKKRMQAFKKAHNITTPINISIIPMNWKSEIGI